MPETATALRSRASAPRSSSSTEPEVCVARIRTLFLQRAPADEVLRACAAVVGWQSPAGQEALREALVTDHAAMLVAPAYRQRVLKALLRALDGHEICEALLEAYLSGGGTGAGGDGWSVRTFEVEGTPIALMMSDVIGGAAETSGCLWPACPALAAWLQARAADLAGATVLELGAGTGLASLALACCADIRSVTVTDNASSALRNLREAASALPPRAAARVSVEHLDWLENEWLGDGVSVTNQTVFTTAKSRQRPFLVGRGPWPVAGVQRDITSTTPD